MALSFSCYATLHPQPPASKSLQRVREMVKSVGIPSIITPPHLSLQSGDWVKLICGASFEDVVDVRNLSLVYTLAGGVSNAVDCIDCAADASVVCAVNEGIEAAMDIMPLRRPWIMISVNDDEDIHFRKAEFDPEDCPIDCLRPCEKVCPANAISLEERVSTGKLSSSHDASHVLQRGVITERCYGCGRCSPVCPYDKIGMVAHLRDAASTAELLKRNDVDAVEIHTSARDTHSFEQLWKVLGDSVNDLRLVALDGRPMSGDTGRGSTRKAISFAVHLAAAEDRPPGFLQLAGGTNAHTVNGLKKEGIFQTSFESWIAKDRNPGSETLRSTNPVISGVAFGGYARKIVGRILSSLESKHGLTNIENHPEYLKEALREALDLVGTVKCYNTP